MNNSDSLSPKIAIIDYKLSNLFSVQHACEFVGLNARITSSADEIQSADAAILPGVGAFGDAIKNLENLGLIGVIQNFIKSKKPFLGICLGLQLLFTESEEFGKYHGLDVIPGKVVKFPHTDSKGTIVKVPQIGWNSINAPRHNPKKWENSPLSSLTNGELMYFVHSYYIVPQNKNDILTETKYGETIYASSIIHNNVIAFQFHPEKSGSEGIKIYKHWAENNKINKL
jgi:glutamine amidotransferase